MSGDHFGTSEDDMNDAPIAVDAIHQRFQSPRAICLDCNQFLNEKDLGNHYRKVCGERCGEGCCRQKCQEKYKRNCTACGGLVYPFLTEGREIRFHHSCAKRVSSRGSKYICTACSRPHDSHKAFEHHIRAGCFERCPNCDGHMFKKLSVFGVVVDHVCHAM